MEVLSTNSIVSSPLYRNSPRTKKIQNTKFDYLMFFYLYRYYENNPSTRQKFPLIDDEIRIFSYHCILIFPGEFQT